MKKRIILDLLFYLGLPLLVWNFGRQLLGDYYAILIGMVPAVIYTFAMAIIHHDWNVTGIFFMSLISLNWVFNLLSHNALQELWNGVWMCLISLVFYLFTVLIRKPIGLYFFVDYAFAKGVPRERSRALYGAPGNYHFFVWFTLFLALREVVISSVKSILILRKGVAGFNLIQITSSTLSYIFTGLTVLYVIYILKQVIPKAGNKKP